MAAETGHNYQSLSESVLEKPAKPALGPPHDTRATVLITADLGAVLLLQGHVNVVGDWIGWAGWLVAFAALYLRRAFASAFPVSLFFAVWTFLQVYFSAQQASFWAIAAPGQINRLLLFVTLEIILLAVNRGQILVGWDRARAALFAARRAA